MPDTPVHVIDDSEDVRESLALLLDVAGYPCRTWGSALDFLKAVQPGWKGCIVADVRMPGMTGIELQKELHLRGLTLPVVIITAHADVPMAVAALKAGAIDFIEKPFRDEMLLAAIRTALATPAEAVGRPGGGGTAARLASLSEREHEVMLLLVAGHPNKVVADRLGISPRTVEVHRAHIMEKTGARTLADLVRMACLYGEG
ncbi:response regulator transcription factor [Magnetospirillum sp. UT-4]|uniref:response regulator transcription factor n=1 Tax=Magnetospirillum sp. UT-4 TaxID=2681467 RepID=UPI0013837FE3|nr:response regulator [Magnetospirillum sp. UT-4]CAA7623767.1 Transcriptional regulatory protein FixJ [Magnetospirillum sp. UT-4]